jgi:hypothetical protein
MTTASLESVAQAEKILSRTLAYQAAMAVHELNDRLGLDVLELRLTVSPHPAGDPRGYRVICTIVSLAAEEPVTVGVVIQPDRGITPIKGNNVLGGKRRASRRPA